MSKINFLHCQGTSCFNNGQQIVQQKELQHQDSLGFKKFLSSPPTPAPTEGCVEPIGALTELRLIASTLSNPNSLTLQLTSELIPNKHISTLINSGSTHCFLDSVFASNNQLQTYDITLIPLHLFDGLTNSVI